jgi:uncharacterized membrane protein
MEMLMIPQTVLEYFLYFCEMAFTGWIIETIYRSINEKRYVNPGFLYGPFVPIYGFGAVIITLVSVEAKSLPPVAAWTVTLLSPTILEYFGGWLMERVFGLKLWDYHSRRFNIKGRICLRFSLYWAAFAALLVLVIQPAVFRKITYAGPYLSHFFSGALFAYFVVDVMHSAKSIVSFKAFQADIASLLEKGRQFHPAFDFGDHLGKDVRLPSEVRRIIKPLASFPALRTHFKDKLPVLPEWIQLDLEKRFWK